MKKINILLADDHQIVLDGLESFLKTDIRIGTIITVHSGEAVLEQLEKKDEKSPIIDVVVLDINMPPGMDGIDTAKYIRRRFPNLKIILLTMVGDGHFILNALRMGIHGYVVKEKSKEVLLAAIETVMLGKRYFSPDLLERIPEMNFDAPIEIVQLTKREKEILCILTREPSLTAREIGEKIFIARTTVERHVQNIKDKLNLHRNTELILYAKENKICDK